MDKTRLLSGFKSTYLTKKIQKGATTKTYAMKVSVDSVFLLVAIVIVCDFFNTNYTFPVDR